MYTLHPQINIFFYKFKSNDKNIWYKEYLLCKAIYTIKCAKKFHWEAHNRPSKTFGTNIQRLNMSFVGI